MPSNFRQSGHFRAQRYGLNNEHASVFFFALLTYAPIGWSECAPGIPGAGNPACIPPTALGSPYAQPGSDVTADLPPYGRIGGGAIAMNYGNGVSGGVKDGSKMPVEERSNGVRALAERNAN